MSTRFSGDFRATLARVDEVLSRGDRDAFSRLIDAIMANPGGPEAEAVMLLH